MTAHPTDDQGYPLCRCEACREKSKIINAQFVARLFGGIVKASSNPMAEVDYDGDLGREWLDSREPSV